MFEGRIDKIKDIHLRRNDCNNSDKLCCHLLKYLEIFKKIATIINSSNNKEVMQLSIEKICYED